MIERKKKKKKSRNLNHRYLGLADITHWEESPEANSDGFKTAEISFGIVAEMVSTMKSRLIMTMSRYYTPYTGLLY